MLGLSGSVVAEHLQFLTSADLLIFCAQDVKEEAGDEEMSDANPELPAQDMLASHPLERAKASAKKAAAAAKADAAETAAASGRQPPASPMPANERLLIDSLERRRQVCPNMQSYTFSVLEHLLRSQAELV